MIPARREMRIYQMDGLICFDTDDLDEARLLDAYAEVCESTGASRAARSIAAWLEERISYGDGGLGYAGTVELAQGIRNGEWRD